MAICGPKMSICCLLISGWGAIQLAVLGVLFYFRSIALLDDLPLNIEDYDGTNGTDVNWQILLDKFFEDVDTGYTQNAYNCWIAAGLYVGSFLISAQQSYMNFKSSSGSAI